MLDWWIAAFFPYDPVDHRFRPDWLGEHAWTYGTRNVIAICVFLPLYHVLMAFDIIVWAWLSFVLAAIHAVAFGLALGMILRG